MHTHPEPVLGTTPGTAVPAAQPHQSPPPPPSQGVPPSFWARSVDRLFGGQGRLVGLDVARGLAVLGMFVAHLFLAELSEGLGWAWVFDGRSSILFATLAGVSLTIISGRPQPYGEVTALQARVRVLVRAVLIFAIGGLLSALGTPVLVILEMYAVLFVLALPFLRWSAGPLLAAAAACAVIMPFGVALLGALVEGQGLTASPIVELMVTGHYPGLLWITFMLLGMGIGRLRIEVAAVQATLVGVGALLAAVAYSVAAALTPAAALDDVMGTGTYDTWEGDVAPGFVMPDLGEVARSAEAHSGGLLEVIGSGGVAMAVIGLCLLLARPLRWVVFPVAAVGSMALTAYSVHIVALWRIGYERWAMPGTELLVAFVLVTVAACTLWRFFLGRGPLERLLTWVSRRAARIPAP